METDSPVLRGNGEMPAGPAPVFASSASAAMQALEQVAVDVAATDVPVLILGESGTGKRALAQQIHWGSPRRKQFFSDTSCAGLTLESLSAAVAGSNGSTNLFKPGTVFLSEIGDIASACQPKVLRLLFEADGAGQAKCRVIASTRKNLEQEIHSGRFREDLYYRLSGVCLRVPPLRHRKEDILALSNFFLEKYATLLQRPKPALSSQVQRFFLEYAWPGNVRELENAVKMIIALGDERLALASLRSQRGNGAPEKISLKQAARAASRQAERELILKVLSRTRWNRKRAAQELQISYKALLYKLKQIGLDDEVTSCEEITV